jgi:Na+/pantothenate symporter
VVTLFVPILGGLYVGRARSGDALAAIVAGVVTMFAVRLGAIGQAAAWLDPTLAGLAAAAAAFAATYVWSGFPGPRTPAGAGSRTEHQR